ncbi:MAG: hypothetical protein ACRDV4_07780, partial [Acidimicrobiales bacterium]
MFVSEDRTQDGQVAAAAATAAATAAAPQIDPGESGADHHDLAALEVDSLDPSSQYALEHSGLGPADLLVDCVGLIAAAVLVASARSFDHAVGGTAPLLVFAETFLRLAISVPIIAAVLGSTRRRSLMHPVFSEHVHALALPLAAGGLVTLALWS